MLLELNIKNFAIIKDLNVQFSKGLNIITGETGTGKSILIEALGVLLGSRTNKDYIRTGEEEAQLEAVFFIEKPETLRSELKEYGIILDSDQLLIINKLISVKNPSISKVNGKTVNLHMLNNITKKLVDIFGQHEHQSLLDLSNHKKIIDAFGDDNFYKLKADILKSYQYYYELKESLDELSIDSSARDREIDILEFQIDEIESAQLGPEDRDIDSRYRKLKNLNNIREAFAGLINSLDYEGLDSINIIDSLNKDLSDLREVREYDENIESIFSRLESTIFELEDINRESKTYVENLSIDLNELLDLEKRLDQINTLKNKYGESMEDILAFKEDAEYKLERLMNQDKEIELLNEKIRELEARLEEESLKLSNMRKDIAETIEMLIAEELEMLNMKEVKFKVDFERNDFFSKDGFDKIEFLISTNLGEDLKPLSRIASGGEMSRIMLAFKNILAEYDNIPTLIFDEIDTGISGRTAQIVGEKIYEISNSHQVICISHLPQITALADSHYSINKEIIGDKTGSYIKKLDSDERIEEMARLIAGADITETTRNHAIEMLEMAKRVKLSR